MFQTSDTSITGEMLALMPDPGPAELVAGKLVKTSAKTPLHGMFVGRIARLIDDFVQQHNSGEVMVGEVGIYTGRNPDTVRAADVLYISHERLARATPDSFLDVAPELIVEILSPGDRWANVRQKLREYFAVGVNVVLLVEPQARLVSLYRSPTELVELNADETLKLDDILPGFSLPLSQLFDPAS